MLDLHSYTILLSVVAIIVAQQTVAAIGKPVIQKYVWRTYCQSIAPLLYDSGSAQKPQSAKGAAAQTSQKTGAGAAAAPSGSSNIAKLNAKHAELRETIAQRNSISAQDQYAKWTKLNRQADKLEAEIKQLNEALVKDEQRVGKYVGYLITLATTLPIWFFRVWYRKNILFYLPPGVLPYPVEWLLALPFLPTGAVGLTVWMFALNSVVGSIVSFAKFQFVEPKVEKPEPPVDEKQVASKKQL